MEEEYEWQDDDHEIERIPIHLGDNLSIIEVANLDESWHDPHNYHLYREVIDGEY